MTDENVTGKLTVTQSAQVNSLIVGSRASGLPKSPEIDPPDMGSSGNAHVTTLSIGANCIHANGVEVNPPPVEPELSIYSNSIQAKATSCVEYIKNDPITGKTRTTSYTRGLQPSPLILQPEGGNVGIGTSNPEAKLVVQGNDDGSHADFWVSGRLMSASNHGGGLYVNGTDCFVGSDMNGGIGFTTNNSWRLNVSKDGNVGIGITSPSAPLHLVVENTALKFYPYNHDTAVLSIESTTNVGYSVLNLGNPAQAWQLRMDGTDSNKLKFYDATHQRYGLTIDGMSNVGIGTSSPQAKLDIQADKEQGVGLIMRDASEHERFRFNTWSNDLIIKDAGGKEVLTFNGGNGNLSLPGDISLTGGDCAEQFDISPDDLVEAGSVVVIDEDGVLMPSHQAYDKRVAGVISGAGALKPGLTLDRHANQDGRLPLALIGKVYCKVDAQYGSIEVGDLLTTSATPAHAMKVTDPSKAFGTVIGKALGKLKGGQGLIPILVSLQ